MTATAQTISLADITEWNVEALIIEALCILRDTDDIDAATAILLGKVTCNEYADFMARAFPEPIEAAPVDWALVRRQCANSASAIRDGADHWEGRILRAEERRQIREA